MSPRVRVRSVASGSSAERAGIGSGCSILRINGLILHDPLEYMYAVGGEDKLEVVWEDSSGGVHTFTGEVDPLVDFGVELEPVPTRTCANRCMFCFIDQMPHGLRDTLYVKDDDWRSSFEHGTYITLTNLLERDIERIVEQRISPLYVSVHASDNEVRKRLMGTEAAGRTFDVLTRLVESGISILAQAVVCEEINDGEVLERTICDLHALYPGVSSLSVVPVGLTRFRTGLADLAPVSAESAGRIVDLIEKKQREYLAADQTRFVFGSDELYLRSGRSLPPAEAYEGFPQLENGVGLVADFERDARDELEEAEARAHGNKNPRILLLTGQAFSPRLSALSAEISKALPVSLEVRPVENRFFGPSVTVAGLLTGQDVLPEMERVSESFDAVSVPEIMFRDDGERSLDDVPFSTIVERAGIPCFKASSNGDVFIRQIESFC